MSTSASPRHSKFNEPVGGGSIISPDVIRTRARAPWPLSRRALPALVAALLATVYLIVQPAGADLPAQLLRTKLFGVEGFGIWNNWWYAGHYLPGYSVLFPALAWLTTPQLVAALASVGTAAAFEALAYRAYGTEAWLGATWLGAATVTELLSGRLTFAFGLSGVALTALALQRQRGWAAVLAAFVTALASPVAALFAALAGATVLITGPGRRTGAGVVVAALMPVVALAIAFPDSGSQPFAFSTLWPLIVLTSLAMVALPRRSTTLRTATALYGCGCLTAYAVSTPVGANAARLGELLAGPLLALLVWQSRDGAGPVPRRPGLRLIALAVAALPLTYLQVHDAVSDLQHGSQAPSDSTGYYRPLIRFLSRQPGAAAHKWRIEVPFTQGHWEADRLAPRFPLARGWERQLDISDNALFYGGRLDTGSYHHWLAQLAVRYVAVADAPPDYSARLELELIDRGLPYLTLVARLPHWRVYQVSDATAIVSGAATLTSLGAQSLTLAVRRAGTAYVRVRWSPYWRVSGVDACVAPWGAFTLVRARSSGTAHLQMSFSLTRIDASSARCG
jgi:hypothetical protein